MSAINFVYSDGCTDDDEETLDAVDDGDDDQEVENDDFVTAEKGKFWTWLLVNLFVLYTL